MSSTPTPPTATFSVRLWRERASPSGLIARITSTTDVTQGDVDRTVVSTRDELQVMAGRWFDQFASARSEPSSGGPGR